MRIEAIERRLHDWAAWFNSGGCVVDGGWPVKNILHPSWLPPGGGSSTPVAAVARSDLLERATHKAIGTLSDKLIATVVVHYCRRMTLEQQAQALGCRPAAVGVRVERAHEQLAQVLMR